MLASDFAVTWSWIFAAWRDLPFEAFSVLFSNGKDRRGWHDSLPKTYVVRKR